MMSTIALIHQLGHQMAEKMIKIFISNALGMHIWTKNVKTKLYNFVLYGSAWLAPRMYLIYGNILFSCSTTKQNLVQLIPHLFTYICSVVDLNWLSNFQPGVIVKGIQFIPINRTPCQHSPSLSHSLITDTMGTNELERKLVDYFRSASVNDSEHLSMHSLFPATVCLLSEGMQPNGKLNLLLLELIRVSSQQVISQLNLAELLGHYYYKWMHL